MPETTIYTLYVGIGLFIELYIVYVKLLYANLNMPPHGLDLTLPLFSVMWVWGCFSCRLKDGAE